MAESIASRIDRMFARDRLMAIVLVVLLWLCTAFVYFSVDKFVTDGGIRIALIIGALALLAFNTASIVAMIRHYREDKEHIYGLDIRHLDENRSNSAR
jgi:nicotinamide riboside transporter PnuC